MSPQADYVVSNGTGAAVRSDINGQLAAIVSNNSGASAPATTYAYMLWADTSTNLLKLRNGANSAWITVGDLTAANLGLATLASPTFTGTATIPTLTVSTAANIPLGSAASPTLYFTGDSNTGLYSPGADQVALSTGGTGRLFINSSGSVGIGTSSPSSPLDVVTGSEGAIFRFSAASTNLQILPEAANGNVAIRMRANSGAAPNFQLRNDAGSNLVTITNGGSVGINSTSPVSILEASQSQNTGTWITSTNSNAGTGAVSGFQANNNTATATFGLGGTNYSTYAAIRANAAFVYCSAAGGIGLTADNANGFINFCSGGPSERMRLDTAGRLLVGTSTGSGNNLLHIAKSANSADVGLIVQNSGTSNNTASIYLNKGAGTEADYRIQNDAGGNLTFAYGTDESSFTERMRIQSDGYVNIGNPTRNLAATGISLHGTNDADSYFVVSTAASVLALNRQGSDGDLIRFFQASAQEGVISVSGSTVTYGGGHLARWSQLPNDEDPSTLLKGTVLSNLDEMCEWGEEVNEQLNKTKVSDVEGDSNVAGVFVATSPSEDGPLDFFVGMTGDMIIRIGAGVTVERGDLLMSAGDGTAKPQDDDIIRSKTIAKVTSTNVSCTYDDGSYCVPCVLMAC